MVRAERAPALFLTLELGEELTAARVLNRQPQIDLEKLGANRADLKVTAGRAMAVGAEVLQRIEKSRRLRRWAKQLGDQDISPAAGIDIESDAAGTEAVLWAIRQSHILIAIGMSTSADPGDLSGDLIDHRIRNLPADHLGLIYSATDLAILSFQALWSGLNE